MTLAVGGPAKMRPCGIGKGREARSAGGRGSGGGPVMASSKSQKWKNSTPKELFRKRSNWKIMPNTTMKMLLMKFITHTCGFHQWE